MKLIIIAGLILGMSGIANALPVTRHTKAMWFYTSAVPNADTDNDGDNALTAHLFSTLSGCVAAAGSAAGVIQGCVANCDPANPTNEYVLEQKDDLDKDGGFKSGGLWHGIGAYGFEADCLAGVQDAVNAGITDVLDGCVFVQKQACQ